MRKIYSILLVILAVILSVATLSVICSAETTVVAEGWALTAGNENGVTNDFKWQLDSEGTLSFYNAGTLNSKELNIDDGNKNSWGWSHPWGSYRADIKKIIIPETVETIAGYAIFGNLTKLETVVIKSEKITLHSATGAFSGCTSLSTLGPEGTPKGTYDIRNIVWKASYSSNSASDNETFFGNCGKGMDITVLLPVADNPCFPYTWNGKFEFKSHDWKSASSVTFKYIEGSVGEDVADVYIESNSNLFSKKKYGPGELVVSGEGSCTKADQGWTTNYTYAFDAVTGKLTFTYVSNNKNWPIFTNAENTVLSDLRKNYGSVITSLEFVGFAELYANWSLVLNFANCVYIDLGDVYKFTNGGGVGIFKNCTALTTVGSSTKGTLEDGIVNLSTLSTVNNMDNMFSGCENISKVVLPNIASISATGKNMFLNCKALTSIVLPKEYTTFGEKTFSGCDSLKSVTLLTREAVTVNTDAIPDVEGLTVCLMSETAKASVDAVGFANTKTVLFNGGIELTSFAVRVKDYNGLRSFFAFDKTIQPDLEYAGFTLVEYGAMVTSKENYELGGTVLVKTGTSYEPSIAKVVKKTIWANGAWAEGAKILDTSTDETIEFAVSIVKYTDNYRSDAYFCGYAVWADSDGNEYVFYDDYSDENEDYKFVNLCDMCIAIYNGTDSYDAITNSEIINGILKAVGYLNQDGTKNETFAQLALGWTPAAKF